MQFLSNGIPRIFFGGGGGWGVPKIDLGKGERGKRKGG